MPKQNQEPTVDEFVKQVLKDAEAFKKKIDELGSELSEFEQFSLAQRLAYKGLDTQIKNTLVELSETFDELQKQMRSQRPVDLGYYLTRMQTLTQDGLTDVKKAIDITKGNKFEGAGFFDDISRALTNFGQWVKKALGFFEKHDVEIKNALDKRTGFTRTKIIDQLGEARDGVGIHARQKGHAVVHKQDELIRPERPKND
jgi:hypothetical protein